MAGETFPGLRRAAMGLWCLACLPVMASTPDCYLSPEASDEELAAEEHRFFPRTHLFQPLIADPRESRFFFGYRSEERATGNREIGVVGFGETFPLYRRSKGCANHGWQVDIAGGGTARFDMDDDDRDMIDVDYLIGLPLSWRHDKWSLRSRIYHESSHLGESDLIDEVMRERRKRSTENVEFISSYTEGKWRLYSGAEYVLRHSPAIEPWGLRLGVEYHGPRSMIGEMARWIAGMDVKAWEEFDFDTDVSIKAGLSFGGRDDRQHDLQVMLEWYDGHANGGVLFEEEIRYVSAAVYFGF